MYKTKTILVNTIPTSYRITNNFDVSKPVTLLLHGWGSNKESFSRIQSHLKNALALDAPGFGQTVPGNKQWDLVSYAQHTADVCTKLGIEKHIDTIIGHSFGGRIAVEMLAHEKLSSNKLVLTGTPITRRKKTIPGPIIAAGRMIKKIPGGQSVRSWFYKHILKSYDYIDAEGSNLEIVFQNIIQTEAQQDLSNIAIPTLLLWGEQDKTIDRSQAEQAVTYLQHGTLQLIPKTGHFAFVDKPNTFLEILKEWDNHN